MNRKGKSLTTKPMVREVVYLDFYNALLQGDRSRCEVIISDLLTQNIDIQDIYVNVFQKAMYRIGKLWEQNNITIAEEHIASQIITSLIDTSLKSVKCKEKCKRKAIVTCIDKEFHQIGAKMVASVFESNGWSTIYMGENMPTRGVLDAIRLQSPDVVGLSFSLYMNYSRLIDLLDGIQHNFPGQHVVLGGQGMNEKLWDKISSYYKGTTYLKSLQEMDIYIRTYEL